MPADLTDRMMGELDAEDRRRFAEKKTIMTEAVQKAVDEFARCISYRDSLFRRIRNDVPFAVEPLQQAQAEGDAARQVLIDVILANK
jgi:hypothetical protein